MWAFLLTPLSLSKPRKHLLYGGASFSFCLFRLVLLFFLLWMHRALQPPKKFFQEPWMMP